MRNLSPEARMEYLFKVAERDLGVITLLDPEGIFSIIKFLPLNRTLDIITHEDEYVLDGIFAEDGIGIYSFSCLCSTCWIFMLLF